MITQGHLFRTISHLKSKTLWSQFWNSWSSYSVRSCIFQMWSCRIGPAPPSDRFLSHRSDSRIRLQPGLNTVREEQQEEDMHYFNAEKGHVLCQIKCCYFYRDESNEINLKNQHVTFKNSDYKELLPASNSSSCSLFVYFHRRICFCLA